MRSVIVLLVILLCFSCNTVSDNVITSISMEDRMMFDDIYNLVIEYEFTKDSNLLVKASDKIDSIDIDSIYNMDFKNRLLGLDALILYYKNLPIATMSRLKEIEKTTQDEELYWVVLALLEEKSSDRLNMLIDASTSLYSIDILKIYLAYSFLENEKYGEAVAIYDELLLTERSFNTELERLRSVAYTFMETPPPSFSEGLLILKEEITIDDLIDYTKNSSSYGDYISDNSFINYELGRSSRNLIRRDFAYFLFSIIANSRDNSDMWNEYYSYYKENLTDEEKVQLIGLSPVTDVELYDQIFYPVLYLVEEEILELPDGEHFFPERLVTGSDIITSISLIKK